MNSSKVKTQKNISALIALAIAFATLFQAGTANSNEVKDEFISFEEAQLVAEFDEFFLEEEMSIEESILEEVENDGEIVKVFNADNELVYEGDPAQNETLRQAANQADYLSEIGGNKYYRIAE